jgi:hypothetical protein
LCLFCLTSPSDPPRLQFRRLRPLVADSGPCLSFEVLYCDTCSDPSSLFAAAAPGDFFFPVRLPSPHSASHNDFARTKRRKFASPCPLALRNDSAAEHQSLGETNRLDRTQTATANHLSRHSSIEFFATDAHRSPAVNEQHHVAATPLVSFHLSHLPTSQRPRTDTLPKQPGLRQGQRPALLEEAALRDLREARRGEEPLVQLPKVHRGGRARPPGRKRGRKRLERREEGQSWQGLEKKGQRPERWRRRPEGGQGGAVGQEAGGEEQGRQARGVEAAVAARKKRRCKLAVVLGKGSKHEHT